MINNSLTIANRTKYITIRNILNQYTAQSKISLNSSNLFDIHHVNLPSKRFKSS